MDYEFPKRAIEIGKGIREAARRRRRRDELGFPFCPEAYRVAQMIRRANYRREQQEAQQE